MKTKKTAKTTAEQPKQQTTIQPVKPKSPKRLMKNEITFVHDLFHLKVENMKKNVSYKKYRPDIVKKQHTHFYHSKNMRGENNCQSSQVGGHFHLIEVEVTEGGDFIASCGPALRKVTTVGRGGSKKTVIEPVQWLDEFDKKIIDNHIHIVEYLHSEEIRLQKQKQSIFPIDQQFSQLDATNLAASKNH